MRSCLCFAILAATALPAAADSYPKPAEARAVCRHVVARGPAIASELVKTGVLDANNDGKPDDVTVGMGQGTMAGDVLEFRPRGASDSPPVDYKTEGFEGKDYWGFGARWLNFDGRVYTLHFEAEDFRRPIYLGFIDAQNKEHMVCDFAVSNHEILRPAAREHAALCTRVARGDVRWIKTTSKDDDESFPTGRRNTALKGRVTIDVRNTGTPQSLALLEFGFSGGRGCDFSYFDLLNSDQLTMSGDAHDALVKLQRLDFSGRSPYVGPACRGNNPRWFSDRGKTYFDNASTGSGEFRSGPFHDVKLIRGATIETICTGRFTPVWRLKTIGPKFR